MAQRLPGDRGRVEAQVLEHLHHAGQRGDHRHQAVVRGLEQALQHHDPRRLQHEAHAVAAHRDGGASHRALANALAEVGGLEAGVGPSHRARDLGSALVHRLASQVPEPSSAGVRGNRSCGAGREHNGWPRARKPAQLAARAAR